MIKEVSHVANQRVLRWSPVLMSTVFLVGFVHSYWYNFYQPDDAFIYLVYVKSFLNDLGLTFNGELVEGYSSLIWTLVVSAASWLGADPLSAAKWIGWISYLAMGGMLAWMHRAVSNDDRPVYLITSILYFLFPTLAMWSAGAMEAVLFGALIVGATFSYYHGRIVTPSIKTIVVSGLLFGLISATRPEGFALVGTILAFELILFIHRRKINLPHMLTAVACYATLTGAMFLGRKLIYSEWFPVTVGAKTGNMAWQIQLGTDYVLGFIKQYALICIAYLASVAYALIRLRENVRQYFLAWISLIVVAGYLLFNLLVGGDWMLGWRFLVPILPFIALTVGLALGHLDFKWIAGALAILALAMILNTLELHDSAYRETLATRGDIEMGKYIKSLEHPSDTKIAVVDAGAIPYYAELPTIDMIGLNDNHISKLPGGFLQKYDNEYVLKQEPKIIQFHTKYIGSNGTVAPTEAFRGALVLFYTPEFQRWYEHDPHSPVAHLFTRRDHPLGRTFLDTFFDASITGSIDGFGSMKIRLEKTGDGVWVAQESQHLEAGVVYVRVNITKNDGTVLYEKLLPIKKHMGKGDKADFELALPPFEESSYRVTAWPTLLGVRDLTPAFSGDLFDQAFLDAHVRIGKGTYSFKDNRLGLSGWSGAEVSHIWSLGSESFIYFNLEDDSSVDHLTFEVTAFEEQSLAVTLNGREVYHESIDGDVKIDLNVHNMLHKENFIRFHHPNAKTPNENDSRKIAIALKSLTLR